MKLTRSPKSNKEQKLKEALVAAISLCRNCLENQWTWREAFTNRDVHLEMLAQLERDLIQK